MQDGSETCYDVWFEDVLVTKRQEAELVVELKMLRKELPGGTGLEMSRQS